MPDQRENVTDAQLLESLFLQYRDKIFVIVNMLDNWPEGISLWAEGGDV